MLLYCFSETANSPYTCMLCVFFCGGKKIKNTQIMLTCLSLSQINNLDYFRLHGQEPALINKHEARLKCS